ncbi:hypothetical protein [Arenicella xantha]|uniref:Carbohydrate binding protein n=1 Tax=Arenicella xantha TaxID=644221 RepID=A0A395JNA3_9GAMM|nr:hypothetical protein [Arenicella xantha]RBP51064.1 hypothetical protein DFR28_102483 [Arenicella xantha]
MYKLVLVSLVIAVLWSGTTSAHNKVVVIPLGGEESNWRGEWLVGQTYSKGDVASNDGNSYLALVSHDATESNRPPAASHWGLVAARGEPGPQGPAGLASFNLTRRSATPVTNGYTSVDCNAGEVAISCGTFKSNASEEDVMGCYVKQNLSGCYFYHDESGGSDNSLQAHCMCLALPQ